MPVNSSHAYARGNIFRQNSSCRIFLFLRKLFNWFERQNGLFAWEAFRKNCVLGRDCNLGPNSWCMNFGVRNNIEFGERVYCRGIIRCGTQGREGGRIVIGDDVYIGDDTVISSTNCVKIGKFTMISHGVHIIDSDGHPTDPHLRERDWRIVMGRLSGDRPEIDSAPIIIGKRVWISFNSIVLQGVTIGDNAIVAAGAIVVSDVPANTIVAGNPARVVKKLEINDDILNSN